VKASDDTIIYLLKTLGFNNEISFKGYELKHMSAADIALEMEKFVQNLAPGSPHLRFIRISSSLPKEFKLSFGQNHCLASTLDRIVEKMNEVTEQPTQTSQQPARVRRQRRERVINEVDLLNIQDIWNVKLSEALKKHNLIHNNFPIVKSITSEFPYKFFIKCPKCLKDLLLTITHNASSTGIALQPHYRFYAFTSHVIKCMKK
jgi:hypothetical protein